MKPPLNKPTRLLFRRVPTTCCQSLHLLSVESGHANFSRACLELFGGKKRGDFQRVRLTEAAARKRGELERKALDRREALANFSKQTVFWLCVKSVALKERGETCKTMQKPLSSLATIPSRRKDLGDDQRFLGTGCYCCLQPVIERDKSPQPASLPGL